MNLNKILIEGIENYYQIYCDLDQVLADFDKRFEHFSGLHPDEYMVQATQQFGEKIAKQKFWNLIDDQVGVRFWRGEPFMEEGQKLWSYIKQYNPIILTAPSKNEVSRIGKRLWVNDHLGTHIQIEFRAAEQKKELSGPNQILIDDLYKNIISWKSENGIGLLYNNNADEIIRELNKLGI